MGSHEIPYTDAKAIAAMGAKADANPLHHDRATEWGATEHTAIGNDAPHHTKYTNNEALAAAIAGGLNKIVWLDNSVQVMTDNNRTSSLPFTDLDLTASTSSDAKLVILLMMMHIDSISSGSGNYVDFRVRKNGTTPSRSPTVFDDGISVAAGSYRRYEVFCAVDPDEVIEYEIGIIGTVQVDTEIQVLGYIK